MPERLHQSPVPIYRRISHQLVERIIGGSYPVGSLLPTEQKLCSEYGVSRYTVREALRLIEALGMVARKKGQGTRVRSAKERRSFKLTLRTFGDVEQHGYFTRLVDVRTDHLGADEALARELPCPPNAPLVRIRCYREPVDDSIPVPTAWNETYIVEPYGSVAAEIGRHDGPVYGLIERMFDERISEIEQQVQAVLLEPSTARKLSVAPRSAGLRVKRTYFGRNGKPVMFGYNTYAGDRFTLTMRLRQD